MTLSLALAGACASGDGRDDSSDSQFSASANVTMNPTTPQPTTSGSTDASSSTAATEGVDASTGEDGPTCGDGVVDGDEACDDGNDVDEDACLSDCTEAVCGDGVVWAGEEECDDGNADEGDGCSSTCKMSTCGDGVVEGDEQCDDGNTDNDDSCLDTCAPASCGDGHVLTGDEQCDDGGESASCNDDCTNAACGDQKINTSAGETCDDGGESAACDSDCTAAQCGDDTVNEAAGETCDDGNTDEGDGCDASCALEISPQCDEPYNVLDSAARNVITVGAPYYCDSADAVEDWVGPGWYRFQGSAGNKMVHGAAPPKNACGTEKTGWLNTPLPDMADGVVPGQVCFNWNNTCNWQANIQVVNCGDFYLYNLPIVPSCNGRYCGTAQ